MRSFVWIPAMLFILYYGAMAQDTSCGIIWYPPIQLSDTAFDALFPQVTVTGDDTVHVIWENHSGTMHLPYRRSTNGGVTFEPVRELVTDSITYPWKFWWNYIVTKGNEIFIFCLGGSLATYTPIHMIRSHNAGSTWDPVKNISSDSAGIISSVAMFGGTIGIIYSPPEHNRRLIRSTNNGLTWSRTDDGLEPSTTATLTSGAVHIIYQVGINHTIAIEYRLSHALGTTWGQPIILSDTIGNGSDVPIIGSSDNINDPPIVIASWRDSKYGCWGILGCSIASRTGIVTGDSIIWNQEEILTDFPRGYPLDVEVMGFTRVVAWKDELVPNKVFHPFSRLSKSLDSATWCPTVDHNPVDTNEVGLMQVALTKKAIHIVWDQKVSRSSKVRAFYRKGEFVSTSVNNISPNIPKAVMLKQNYPNPFNPSTTIKYHLPSTEYVTIKIYDVFGRELGILVNERKQAGEYEVEWNAAGLASGVYFYRILAGTLSEAKKAILLN